MSEIKQRHIVTKTLWQIFIVFIELLIVVGISTYISNKFYPTQIWIELIERIGIFYGIYQIVVYIILSTMNDIKVDEYLALKTAISYAMWMNEGCTEEQYKTIIDGIDKELETNMHNGIDVRNSYIALKNCIQTKDIHTMEFMKIHAEHCAEMCKLQWRFSFLLRLLK